jgi:sugar lactone lactonase YvrE
MAICLGATAVSAATSKPAVVVSQANWLSTLQGGGALSGDNPAGGSFAVNSKGDVLLSTTYGGKLLLVNGQTGAVTTLSSAINGPGPVLVDSSDNLYVAQLYAPYILKVPYVNGAYVPITITGSEGDTNPAACTGKDTTLCTFAVGLQTKANGWWFGVASMAFDASGDLFVNTVYSSGSNNIWECNAKCEFPASGSYGAPALLYTDTNYIGSLALDPWGNLFYTETVYSAGSTSEALSSSVNELAYTSGAYAAKPTVITTYTDASPYAYDDNLDALTADASGNLYYSTSFDGVYVLPNNKGVLNTAGVYTVTNQGAKLLALDASNNIYLVSYSSALGSGGDTLARISLNSVAASASPVGTVATTTVGVALNDASCTTEPNGVVTGPTVAFAASENGAATKEFTGATTGGCTAQPGGASYSVTLTFKPVYAGERSAALTVTDKSSGSSAVATVTGVGNGALATLDPGVVTAYASGFSTPASVSADADGNIYVADSGANSIFEIPAGKTAPVVIAEGLNAPAATVVDAAGNLFVANSGSNEVVELALPTISSATTRSAAAKRLSAKPSVEAATFGGTALANPTGLAIGPDGVLYISDTGNNRVVTFNPSSGATGVAATGLETPAGIAVDASSNLYIANQRAGNVLIYSGGVATTLTLSSVTEPSGVAVDASGSVLVADASTGSIWRIPSEAGVLTTTDAIVVEDVGSAANGLASDPWGNLYTADTSTATVYAINRLGASLSFGTVADGSSSSAQTIYVENAGNQALGVVSASKAPTGFSLVAAAADACGSGSFATSIAVGTVCDLAAEFSPTGTQYGTETGTITLTSTTAKSAKPTVTLTGNAINAGTKAQTITFAAPTSPVTYGAASITLSAKASSKLKVTLTVTGPATLTGTTLKFTGAGTVVVTATQNGNGSYAAATPVSHTIAVNAATLTFTATSASVAYNAALPKLTYTVAGFVNGDTAKLLTGAPTLTTTAKKGSTPGTYPITIAQNTLALPSGNYNYSFAFTNGTLTITALGTVATPTITPAAGAIASGAKVTIKDTKDTAGKTVKTTIYYTTDGSDPSTSSTAVKYTAPFAVTSAETVTAVGEAAGYTNSALATAAYTIK